MGIFEGAIRKWVFPSYPALAYLTYFSKDILFFYAGYLGARRTPLFDMSWVALCVVLITVPSAGATLMSSNPVGVFLALRAYLLIPICAYLAASLIRGFQDIERCALVIAVAAMGVAVLSVYQYRLPPSHMLNRYAGGGADEMHIVAQGGHVRATGTFAYISGMAMLAGLAAWAGALLILPLPGRAVWKSAVGAGSLASGFVCSATAMSRGGLFFVITIAVGSCLLFFRPKHVAMFLLTLLLASSLIGGGGEQWSSDVGGDPDSLTSGLSQRLSQEGFFVDRVNYILLNLYLGATRHPLGEGLGVGQAGSRYASGATTNGYESEWGRIAFEIGPIGLITVLGIRLAVCRRLWKCLTQTSDPGTRLVMACSLPYFGLMSLGWMAFNHTGNTFAWSVATLGLAAAGSYCCGVSSDSQVAMSLETRTSLQYRR